MAWNGTRYVDAGVSGVIGFLGQPGTGKSYRAMQYFKKCRRVVLLNTVGTYQPVRMERKNYLPGFVVIRTPRDLVAYLRRRRAGSFRVNYIPAGGSPRAHFEDICRLVLALGDVVFVVDEIWMYQRANWSPEVLEEIMFVGRHSGVVLMWTAQRPAEVDKSLISVSTSLHVGRLGDVNDLKSIKNRLPAEALAEVPRLPDRAFLVRDEQNNWKIEKSKS